MSIKMIIEDEKVIPILVCDHCNKPIINENGAFQWAHIPDGGMSDVYMSHRNEVCFEAICEKYGFQGWGTLSALPTHLQDSITMLEETE